MRRRAGTAAIVLTLAAAAPLAATSPPGEAEALARLCAWVADPARPVAPPADPRPLAPGWPPPAAEVRACFVRASAPPEALSAEAAAAALAALVPDREALSRLREAARTSADSSPAACRALLDCLADGGVGAAVGAAAAIPAPLRAEFERLCAQTDSAAGLEAAALADLVAAADRLEAELAPFASAEARILRQRLRRCRELFDYLRILREQKDAVGPPN